MSIDIGTLYHWSPKINRVSILKNGLQLMNVRKGNILPGFDGFPWICLGTTPSSAWSLIMEPEQDGAGGEKGWDLWQVFLRDGDNVQIRTDFDMPYIREIRVHNGLPADRLWWVGERQEFVHLTI